MEMQNVLKQMTDMLSVNVSKELFPGSLSGTTGSKFETVMSKQMSGASQKKEMSTRKEDTANTDVDGSTPRKEEISTENGMQNGTGDTTEVVTQEIPEEVVETVAQWMNTMQEQICEKLNLTPEELESVMSQLGLQFTDLQDMSKVQQLVLQLAGEDNVAALLTNEQLNTQVQDILQIAVQTEASFAEELQIPDEEFGQLVQEVLAGVEGENTKETQANTDVQGQIPEETFETESAEVVSVSSEEADQMGEQKNGFDQVTTDQFQEEAVIADSTDDFVAAKETGEEEVAEATEVLAEEMAETDNMETAQRQTVKQAETGTDEEQSELRKLVGKENVATNEAVEADKKATVEDTDTSKKQHASQQEKGNQTSLFDQMMEQVALAKAEHVESVQDRVTVVQQMREVFEQVVEQIKVTVTADTSEMTMQLNPENLGKVNLSIVAKEGHITAQFVTETEVARQALESQIQQLRDTLGEQGLKVDKVEVSVSDFSFAQQNNTNAEEQKEQQRSEHAKQVHRNLNLSSLEEVTDLTEEEELAVKIMRSNGNQIDFTA